MSLRIPQALTTAIASIALTQPALAHEQAGVAGGLVSGLLHPITGIDHLVAMVAVGIWGAQLGAPAIWILPITFPLVMAIGGVMGVLHVPLPMPELMIAASAVILGVSVAARLRLPFPAAALVVAIFAIFHGHAHGAELPLAANALAYGVGFVTATGLLHLFGIAMGTLTRWPAGERIVQGLGAGIAGIGCYFLAQGIGALA
ncbi:HupE/UreJ family protein [Bradyrhizobium ganzhouense]|uniref:HupE/UreJ family protein n=1 Tax=Bradyrhizobium ganzhouense TaxID=1179767 RepID=UPI003CE6DD87